MAGATGMVLKSISPVVMPYRRVISASPEFVTSEWLERVVVVGLPDTPQTVSFGNQRLGFVFDAVTRRLEIKKPGCNMGHDFEIVIQVSP